MIKNIIILLICVTLVGCSALATKTDDGKTLKINCGIGSCKATFEGGASIEKGILPPMPVKVQN